MRQLIIARKDLNMSPGKLAAQVSHASMAFLSNMIRNGGITRRPGINECEPDRLEIFIEMDPKIYDQWLCGIFTKTICEAKNRNQLTKAVTIAAGYARQEKAPSGGEMLSRRVGPCQILSWPTGGKE